MPAACWIGGRNSRHGTITAEGTATNLDVCHIIPQDKHGRAKSSPSRLSQSNSPIWVLSVGPDGVKFYAHEEVLSKSYLLEQYCSGGLRKSETRHIDLPEDDPELIGHLLDYLYTGHYIYAGDTDDGDDVAELLAKIYVLADKHILDDLQVLTVEYFAEEDCLPLLSEESFLKISQYIYENTVDEEPVYKDFLKETAWEWFMDETKHLDAYVEPYTRKGDTFAYHIFQAQLQASALRKN